MKFCTLSVAEIWGSEQQLGICTEFEIWSQCFCTWRSQCTYIYDAFNKNNTIQNDLISANKLIIMKYIRLIPRIILSKFDFSLLIFLNHDYSEFRWMRMHSSSTVRLSCVVRSYLFQFIQNSTIFPFYNISPNSSIHVHVSISVHSYAMPNITCNYITGIYILPSRQSTLYDL